MKKLYETPDAQVINLAALAQIAVINDPDDDDRKRDLVSGDVDVGYGDM